MAAKDTGVRDARSGLAPYSDVGSGVRSDVQVRREGTAATAAAARPAGGPRRPDGRDARDDRRAEGRATWLRLVVAVVLLGAAYVALAVVVGRQVPSQASVEGVDVGGMTPAVASATLKRELAASSAAPIDVVIGQTGKSISIDPSSSGLGVDIDGTLAGMSGFSLDPRRIWEHLTGQVHRPVLTTVDASALTEAVTTGVKTVESPARDGAVGFTGGRVTVTPAQIGTTVDVSDLVAQLRAGYPRTPSVVAKVANTQPKVTEAKVEQAVSSFAAPAMSAPVSLVVGNRTAPLLPSQLSPYLGMTADASGTLRPAIDGAKVTALVQGLATNFLQQPVDASIVLQGGKPVVVPSIDGTTFDASTVPATVLAALTDPARTASLKPVTAPASFTTAQATALGVKEVVASFDSPYPTDPTDTARTATLVAGAATLNGTLVKPGDTFSLNGILGPRTTDKGFQEGYVASGTRQVPSTTGAMSQIATVVYNLAWFAGAELGTRTAHATYVSRYPEGRDAVVAWPGIDTTWRNTSPYGMLVETTVSNHQVHGRIWSTRVYDVQAQQSAPSNVVAPTTITDTSAACVPHDGVPGFDVTVTRVLTQPATAGKAAVVRNEPVTTSYAPLPAITCTAAKPTG